jgi:leucine efflux protein
MLGVPDIWTYVIGTILIVLLPGPNSLFVLSTAARSGVRNGYRAAAGVFLGDTVLMLAAAFGAASLLKAYPPVFMTVKYAGAAYLGYLGISMAVGAIRNARRRDIAGQAPTSASGRPVAESTVRSQTQAGAAVPAEGATGSAGGAPAVARPFRRALVISLLNPKAILFFISFFVQFLDPGYAHPELSFLLLATILQICSALYLTALIFGGTFLANQFRRRRRLAAGLTAGVGAVFIGFGLRLATATLS